MLITKGLNVVLPVAAATLESGLWKNEMWVVVAVEVGCNPEPLPLSHQDMYGLINRAWERQNEHLGRPQDKTGYMATEIGAKQGNSPTQDILAPKLLRSINYSSENSHILCSSSDVLRKLRNKFDNRQLLLTLPQIAPHNLWLQIVLHPKRLRGGWVTPLKSQRQGSKLLLPSTALHAKKVQYPLGLSELRCCWWWWL